MKAISLVSVTAVLAAALSFAEDTEDALKAARVRGTLAVKLEGDKLTLSRDGGLARTFADGADFTASEEISITYPRFNPLEVRITATQKQSPDPSFAQLTQFLDELGALGKLLKAGKGLEAGTALESLSCSGLRERIKTLVENLKSDVVTDADATQWRTSAVGRLGVVAVLGLVRAKQAQLAGNIAKIEESIEQITGATFDVTMPPDTPPFRVAPPGTPNPAPTRLPPPSPAPADGRVESTLAPNRGSGTVPVPRATQNTTTEGTALVQVATCGQAEFQLAQQMIRLVQTYQLLEAKKKLLRRITALGDELDAFGKPEVWTSDDAYLVTRVVPVPGFLVTTSLTVHRIDLGGRQVETSVIPKSQLSSSFRLRSYSWLVPETAAGLIVTSVRQPKYGTSENAEGKTVVTRKGDDDLSYGGAVLLNGVCRCGGGFINPMLQLGVASAEDAPALLIGVGLRFLQPKRIALSGGAIVAWVRDLDTLTAGVSEVGGTTDIENDLKRRATVKAYFALQVSF